MEISTSNNRVCMETASCLIIKWDELMATKYIRLKNLGSYETDVQFLNHMLILEEACHNEQHSHRAVTNYSGIDIAEPQDTNVKNESQLHGSSSCNENDSSEQIQNLGQNGLRDCRSLRSTSKKDVPKKQSLRDLKQTRCSKTQVDVGKNFSGPHLQCRYCQKRRFDKRIYLSAHENRCKRNKSRNANPKIQISSKYDGVGHLMKKAFICMSCPQMYDDQSSLKNHLLTHSDIAETPQCLYCEFVYSTADQLGLHLVTTHAASGFECSGCLWSVCTSASEPVKHLNCTKEKRPSYGKGYLAFKQENVYNYTCVECCFKTTTLGDTKRARGGIWPHINTHMLPKKIAKKKITKENESSAKALKRRKGELTTDLVLKEATKNSKNYNCLECGKEFKTYVNLYQHKQCHVMVVCDICGATLKKISMRLHRVYVHSASKKPRPRPIKGPPREQYACKVCGKQCNNKQNLDFHTNIHLGLKPFACQYCPKAFTQPMHLKRHTMTHTGERPFTCETCGKKFIDRGNYNNHKMLHTGHRPFICDLCGKGYVMKRELARHKERSHTQ